MNRRLTILGLVVGLLLTSAAPAHAKPAEYTTIGIHVVRSGETLYCIGRAYGVSPWAIASHNGLAAPSLIYVGQRLAIPNAYASLPAGRTCTRQFGATTGCACASYHTVKSGENLYRVSLRYGVDMWHIARCNRLLNLNLIRTGGVLCIPAG
jgi:LysM repeat protein